MSDRIAVMQRGRILQVGTPREIYEHPAERFVADFIGETNFLDGRGLRRGRRARLGSPAASRLPATLPPAAAPAGEVDRRGAAGACRARPGRDAVGAPGGVSRPWSISAPTRISTCASTTARRSWSRAPEPRDGARPLAARAAGRRRLRPGAAQVAEGLIGEPPTDDSPHPARGRRMRPAGCSSAPALLVIAVFAASGRSLIVLVYSFLERAPMAACVWAATRSRPGVSFLFERDTSTTRCARRRPSAGSSGARSGCRS